MAEIDQTASKRENAQHNAEKLATKIGDVAMNLPSNEEVLHNLNKVKVELDRAKTAPEIDNTGRRILQDAELLADDLKILVKERNEGDRMQELAREAKLASDMLAAHAKEMGTVSKDGAQSVDYQGINNAAKDGFKSIQVAVMEIVRSSEFRQELIDFLRFAADCLRTGIKDSRKDRVGASKKERKLSRDSSSSHYKSGYDRCEVCDGQSNLNRYDTPQGSQVRCEVCYPGSTTTTTYSNIPGERKSHGVPDKVTDVKHKAESAVNEQLDKLNMPHRIELSDEQLDELVNRFIDIMRSISQRPRTREAFLGIMNFIQLISWELNRNSGRFRAQGQHSAATMRDDDHVRRMIFLAREEIEQFTGGRSVKPFFRHYKAIVRAIREDAETRAYFNDLWHFVNRLIENPEAIDAAQTREETKNFIRRSRSLKNREVTDHMSDSLREGRRIIKRITEDPVLRRMRTDFGRLIDDITKDSYGKFTLDGNVWNQLRLILTYSVIERVRIPLPPIESEDAKRQYRVKDVVLNLRDFVPQKVTLEDHARIQFDVGDLRHPSIRKTRNLFSLFLKNIHFEVHDVDIWFRRKRAPHMETNLKADVVIGPEGKRGLDLWIDLVSKPGQPGMFKVSNVRARINNLLIHVADTRAAFMYNAVLKVIKRRIAARIERSIEDGLRDGLEKLNKILVERVSNPARKAAHAAGDKAGDVDIQELINRFRETTWGQQAERVVHMARGDTAAGKRDRRHAKKNAKNAVNVGKQKAKEYRDQGTERIAQHNEEKYYKEPQDSTLPIPTQGTPVQEAEFVSSYVDASNVRHEQREKKFTTHGADGSTVETRIHQDKIINPHDTNY